MTGKPNLYALVGMKHRGAEALVASLPADEPLILVREPDNKFDRNAIQVWAQGKHVGFISKDQNKVLAGFIDAHGADNLTMAFDAALPDGRKMGAKLHKGSNTWPLVEVG